MSEVWGENHWSEDINTSIWVASGQLDLHTATLNGRPAIFVDMWKAMKPEQREGLPFYYRGQAVWTQLEDHGPFAIDPRYSSWSAEQAKPASATPRSPDLFRDKAPDNVESAADFLGLEETP